MSGKKTSGGTVEITCPCCATWMKVDVATAAILDEKRPRKSASFEEALAAEKERGEQISSTFKKAFSNVENEKEILEKKLQEAMKKAAEKKDEPPPLRDIDLD